jgi:DNA-binding MarR family transcriptional regulator
MQHDQVDQILEQWARERPDLAVSPMGIIGRLSRVSRHLEQALQETFAPFGLNGGEFDVLATLRRAGEPYTLSPTELFNTLMLSSGAMTNRIDRLEETGLAVRTRDPEDRRGVNVTLTPKGRELIDAAVVEHVANEEQLLSALTQTERETLVHLLRKLLLSFEDRSPAN